MSLDSFILSASDEVKELTVNVLNDLLEKWKTMYVVTDEIKIQRFGQFVVYLKDFYKEMEICEEERKNVYLKEIEKKLKECKDLEEALNINMDCELYSENDLPLTERIKKLEVYLKKFEHLKLERMAKYEKIRKKENLLCKILGYKEMNISREIPSEEDIDALDHHIFILEEEKIKRNDQFQKSRDKIVELINCLEVSTLLDSFEKSLVESDVVLSLTPQDLERVKQVENSYQQQFEDAKAKIDYMVNELTKLWNRLDIDEAYRANFFDKHPGVGRRTSDNIQKEIQRCEKLKKQLIEPLIKKTYNSILNMCDQLCFSDEQKEYYVAFSNRQYSEDLLDILELELDKLDFMFHENSEILESAKKQGDLWNRMIELEEASKDKKRLFNNRGGQLLREEKERKTLELTLPKINKKLEDLLIDYEVRNGTPFLYYGDNLLESLRSKFKESNEKQTKIIKKNETKLTEKRKCNVAVTPKSEKSKRLRLATSTTSLASSASKCSNKCVDVRSGSRSRIALFKDHDASVASSYSLFQEEIEEKKWSGNMTSERKPLKDVNASGYVFHSSPSQDGVTPRFNFRPRSNNFTASGKISGATPASRKPTPKHVAMTPVNMKAKTNFATPRTVTKSTSRLTTPKKFGMNNTRSNGSRTFFETPTSAPRSTHKPMSSLIRPAKFKFDL